MARSPAEKTRHAADQLLAWLQGSRPDMLDLARPDTPAVAVAAAHPSPDALPEDPADPVRTAAASVAGTQDGDGAGARMLLPHPDWLHHTLVVSGPADAVASFRHAAAGSGIIPWHLDLDRLEEDAFHLLVAPSPPQQRSLSLAGARVLAGQLRDAAGQRHQAAIARVGRSTACPFDLHTLVPVPDPILRLGPEHPEAVGWLWQHWGTNQALVGVQEDRYAILGRHPVPRRDPQALHVSFWSADWTPWRALKAVADAWPQLRFQIRPEYDRR